MENRDFSEKLNDLSNWCNKAYHHNKEDHYHEALMNMRKSAEAFCKLILYQRHSKQYAASSAAGKSLKELIAILKSEGVVPFEIIHALETLQIHGNMAAHDDSVMSEQSALALSSLRLIIRWLFESFLKIPVQSDFKALLETKGSGVMKQKPDDKNKQDDLEKLKSEKKDLEKQIEGMHHNREHEAERFNKLSEQLKKYSEQIEKINQSLASKDVQVTKPETSFEILPIKTEQPTAIKKNEFTKYMATAVIALFIITGSWWAWKYFYHVKNNHGDKIILNDSVDSLHAFIIPFSILQDNPNLNIKIEEVLLSKLRESIRFYNLPLRLSIDTAFHSEAVTPNQLQKYAEKKGPCLVIGGELYEQTAADSNQVNLMVALNKIKLIPYWQIDKLKFMNLGDQAFTNIIKHCLFYLNVSVADYYMNNNRYSLALALLYQTKGMNKDEAGQLANLITQCQMALKNFQAAELEAIKFTNAYPDNAFAYSLLGNIYFKLRKFKEAEKCFNKMLLLAPGDAGTFLDLAQLFVQPEYRDPLKMFRYANLALNLDSTSAQGWLLLAQSERLMDKTDLAIFHFKKCLSLNPSFILARQELAAIYIEIKNDPNSAIFQLDLILKQDSLNVYALNQLARLYSHPGFSDPVKVAIYLERAGRTGIDTTKEYKYSKAMLAFSEGKENAITLLLDFYKSDSNNTDITDAIFEIYFNRKEYETAKYYLNRSILKDSFSNISCYNAGYFYAFSEPPFQDEIKAIKYFERALLTNPYDKHTFERLADLYYKRGMLNESERAYRILLSFDPKSKFACFGLGLLFSKENIIDSAYYYYDKTYLLYPDDDKVCRSYANFLMKHDLHQDGDMLFLAKKAVEINPSFADNHFTLANVSFLLKKYDLSAKEYTEAVRLNPAFKNDEFEKALSKAHY